MRAGRATRRQAVREEAVDDGLDARLHIDRREVGQVGAARRMVVDIAQRGRVGVIPVELFHVTRIDVEELDEGVGRAVIHRPALLPAVLGRRTGHVKDEAGFIAIPGHRRGVGRGDTQIVEIAHAIGDADDLGAEVGIGDGGPFRGFRQSAVRHG